MKTFCEKLVAQVSKPAVSPISESACVENSGGRRLSEGLQLRKPAIQQTWNSALLPLSLQQSVFIRVNPWLKLCFAAALAFTASIAFAAEPLSENLQKGLFEEEAN